MTNVIQKTELPNPASYYDAWQLARYGNILPTFPHVIPPPPSSCDDEFSNYSIAQILNDSL